MQGTATPIPQKWIYSLLILLSFVLYGNNIRNGYCLDDNFVVTDNPYVQKGLAGINTLLISPYAKMGRITLDYRPIAPVTFAIEHQFFGNNPHISHFINILLYAVCLILLYKLLVNVFKLDQVHQLAPVIITLLFAVHPIHTEVVDSLKSRDELLSLLFGLLFLLYGYAYYTATEHRKRKVALSILFLALCIMSKVIGVLFVGLFIMICWFNDFFKGKKWNYVFILVCILIAIRGIYRAFHGMHRTTNLFENPLETNKDLLIALGTSLKILLYHLKMLVYPSPLCFYYGYNVFPMNGMGNPYAIASLVIHAGLLIFGIRLFFKRDILGLFILLYFVSVFLYSNFPAPYPGMFSERALLLSSIWFISACTLAILRLMNRYSDKPSYKNGSRFLLVGLFCVYAYMTIQRNFLWKDNLTLMSHDIKHLKGSVLANYIYANNLKYASDHTTDSTVVKELANQAVFYYRRTIDLVSNYPEFYYKLASTYRYNLNEPDSAETYFKKVLAVDSFYATAHYELGKLYFEKQDLRKSYQYMGNAYIINPTDSITLYYYGQITSAAGDLATSYKVNKEFIRLYPNLPVAYVNMGVCYSKALKDDSAVINFEKAVQLGYREPQLLNQLVIYFKNKNNVQKQNHYAELLSSVH